MSLTGNTLGYTTEWQTYRHKEGYDKLEYDIMLKDGTIITSCYPNAGYFNPMGKDQKRGPHRTGAWPAEMVDKIRITPFDSQQIDINEDEIYGK